MAKLEDFLERKPLNERMGRLMRGEDEPPEDQAPPPRRTYFDGSPVTDQERKHLQRLLTSAGWQVLLKLLDTEIRGQEDAARRTSLNDPLQHKDEIVAAWASLASNQQARNKIVELAEGEVGKLQATVKAKR